jgi:phosphoribosylglycinamide formyltransferase-1
MGQAEVDVKPGDTADTLAARVLKAEHILFPRCVAVLARGGGAPVRETVTVDGDEIRIFAPK